MNQKSTNPNLASVPLKYMLSGAEDAEAVFLFAHGAGVPMNSPFMTAFAEGLGERGIRVARFEFPYMAQMRRDKRRRPPNKPPVLAARFGKAIREVASRAPKLVIGGKSMGGRIASMIADKARENGQPVAGVVCLGYPFFGKGQENQARIEHLQKLKTPTLIVQGTRDEMGDETAVKKLKLKKPVQFHWVKDGDHNLTPPKSSEADRDTLWAEAMDEIAKFIKDLPAQSK